MRLILSVDGDIEAVVGHHSRRAWIARQLVRAGGRLDEHLSAQWGCLVTCSPEFGQAHASTPAIPRGISIFFPEVTRV